MRCLILTIMCLGLISCTKPSTDVRPSKAYYDKDGKKFAFTQVEIKYQPPAPDEPAEAKALGIHGTVEVMILLDDKGIPIKTEILSGPVELRASAETFAMQFRFLPALIDGKPYAAKFKLTVLYKLN